MFKIKIRIIFILILVCFKVATVFSQPKEFIGSVFFNANGIEFKGDNYIFWQSSQGKIWGTGGISCGINTKKYITKNDYLNLELRYIQKGSLYEYLNQYSIRNLDVIRLNYFEIPILWGHVLYINEKDFFIETGFGLAKLFSSKSKIAQFGQRNYSPDAQFFKNLDLSWISSFKFPLNRKGKRNLLLGFRFSYSLVSIHKQYNIRNMVYGIQIDYILNPH